MENTIGAVSGIELLNIYVKPDADTFVLATLKTGAEVMIDSDGTVDQFYRVYTAAGIVGYCLRKFITIA